MLFRSPIRDEGGAVVGYLKMAEDMSALEATESALRAERDLIARIADTSPAAIAVLSPEGRVTYASRRCEELFGVPRDVLLARSFDDAAFSIEDAGGRPFPVADLPFSRVLATGRAVDDVRHNIRRADGSVLRLSINAAPMLGKDGRVTAVVCSMENITARVEADRRCDFMAAVVESAPQAVVSLNLAGDIVGWNRAAAAVFGYPAEEVLGANVSVLVPAERMPQVTDNLDRIGRGLAVPPFLAERVRRDGSRFTARLALAPVIDAAGEIIGATVTASEVAAS